MGGRKGDADFVPFCFEEFGPILYTAIAGDEARTELAQYDVTIADLLDAGLVTSGQRIRMPYKPRNGDQRSYEGAICDGGSIEL